MKIDLETSKKGNNFLGKEEVGSSNLLVGSTGNQGVKPKSCQHLNSLSETLFKFRCFFVPTLFIHFYRNTIALPSHDYHVLNICYFMWKKMNKSDRFWFTQTFLQLVLQYTLPRMKQATNEVSEELPLFVWFKSFVYPIFVFN